MNWPGRAGVAFGVMVSAVLTPGAVAPALARPATTRPAAIAAPAGRPVAAVPGTLNRAAVAHSAWRRQDDRAAAGGWRLVATDHFGGPSNASGYSAVLATGRRDAWVFGGTNPGEASTPVALHWDGRSWRATWLPSGLGSFISGASASSPANVWAVSSFGGYALRWNGASWSVARRWQPGAGTAAIIAISPTDVWLFGTPGPGGHGSATWNYDGHAWSRVAGPRDPVIRASAVSAQDIWAITAGPGGSLVEYWGGRAWKRVATGSVLAGTQLDDVLAVSRRSVWIVGNSPAATPAGHVVLAHWNGRKWQRIEAPGRSMPRRLAADSRGGVWIAATTLGAQTRSRLLHLSRSGRWTQVIIAHGLGNAVSDLALVPGTSCLWGSGGFLTPAGGDAAIWHYRTGLPGAAGRC